MMTDDPKKTSSNSLSFAAWGWAFSLVVAATALATSVIAIIEFLHKKSVTLEAEFFPSRVAYVEQIEDQQLRERDYEEMLGSALGATNRFDEIFVAGKNSKLKIDDLAKKVAEAEAKRLGPLGRLSGPYLAPDGQIRVVVSNKGDLPANKVRVFVPDAQGYVMKKGDSYVDLPYSEDGAEVGAINQGRSVELFAFTRDSYRYDHGFCTYECDLSVSHDQGIGTIIVRAPRTLWDAIAYQGFAFFMAVSTIFIVGVIGIVAIVTNAIQQAYLSVSAQKA